MRVATISARVCNLLERLLGPAAKNQGPIATAKTKGIGEADLHLGLAGRMGDEIQITPCTRVIQIDGWRKNLLIQRQSEDPGLETSGGPEEMARRGLGRRDRQVVGVISKDLFDGLDLGQIAQWSRGAVRVDVVDTLRRQLGICQVPRPSPGTPRPPLGGVRRYGKRLRS